MDPKRRNLPDMKPLAGDHNFELTVSLAKAANGLIGETEIAAYIDEAVTWARSRTYCDGES